MAANGTAIVLNRVITQLRIASDEYAPPSVLQSNFQMASEMLQNTFLGAIMQYGPGRPIPAHASQITSDIRNLLDPFRKPIIYNYDPQTEIYTADVTALEDAGLQITKFEDWRRNGRSITFPFDMSLSDFIDSEINFPADSDPIGEYIGENQIKVLPANADTTKITAKALVGDPQVTVTMLAGSKKVVDPDPTKTTPTFWRQRAYDCLVYLVLQQFGVQSTQPFLLQSAMALKQQSI